MKSLADYLKIPLLTGIISKERTAAKIRLYDRKLPRVGAFYLYPENPALELTKPATITNGPRDPRKIRKVA
jgi:hypothetical protein